MVVVSTCFNNFGVDIAFITKNETCFATAVNLHTVATSRRRVFRAFF